MMRRALKLQTKYHLDPKVAEALYEAGYTSPAKIRGTSKADLLKVQGVGRATLEKLRVSSKK